jgi:hypothetical protein
MRKSFGVFLAVATLLSLLVVGVVPAGAAGGTTCKKVTSTATITPALPPLTSKTTVKNVVTASTGTFGQCSGGGVTSAHFTLKSVPGKTPANCTTLLTYNPKAVPTSGTSTTTWNTGATSTVAFKLLAIKGKPTNQTFSGSVTAGLFKGMKITVTFAFTAVPKTGCASTPLGKVSVANTGPLVVK